MRKGGNIWKRKRPDSQESTRPAVLYRTCDELPFDRFIKCSCKRDYEALIKEKGTFSFGELVECWEGIRIEFLDLNEDNESLYLVRLEKEIAHLSSHIETVASLLVILSKTYHPEFVRLLHNLGYHYEFDPKNITAYINSLGCVENRLAAPRYKLEQKQTEYEDYLKNKDLGIADEKHYRRILTRLAKHMGVAVIRSQEITTSEFVFMWQDYLQDLKAHQKLLENK